MKFDLSWLLNPLEQDSFIENGYGRGPLRIQRHDVSFYSGLLPETSLEFILQSNIRTPGAVEILVEGDRGVRPQSYAHALEAFRSGKSLRIDAIHRFSEPIMLLCKAMELSIGSHVNANLYLTPGAGKKALARHYDTHDVFVLQVHGNKLWRLYDPPSEVPLEYLPLLRLETLRSMKMSRLQSDQSGSTSCFLKDEFTLRTGDLLYLPRGFWHEAESEPDQISAHLTLGVQPTTYLDLMTTAMAQAATTLPALRASLPYGFHIRKSAAKEIEAAVAKLVSDLPSALHPRAALGQLASIFAGSRGTGVENGILQSRGYDPAKEVLAETPLRVRRGVVFSIAIGTRPVRLIFGQKVMEIAAEYVAACRFVADAGTFRSSQLPGDLSLNQKLVLARQLVSEGILTPQLATYSEEPIQNWFPFLINVKRRMVKWIDLGSRPLSEPFLHQTVARVQRSAEPRPIRTTRLQALRRSREELVPSGFIFHMSRCGSTLLANSLKQAGAATVVSEPQPMSALLGTLNETGHPDSLHQMDGLLKGLVRSLGHRHTGKETSFVLKFSSWQLLHLAVIRKLWPTVPVLLLVREPLEVAVSCLERKPGWMGWKECIPGFVSQHINISSREGSSLSDPEFCARMLGATLREAEKQSRDGCTLLDYKELNAQKALDIAELFRIPLTGAEESEIKSRFSVYSKDPEGKLQHTEDSFAKQNRASEELKRAIDIWAQPSYVQLHGAARAAGRDDVAFSAVTV